MPRKRRDEETILAFWKQFARDKNCPWAHRIWCTFALAVATKVIPATLVPPGVARYKDQASTVPAPPEPPSLQEESAAVSDFLSKLQSGGTDAPDS